MTKTTTYCDHCGKVLDDMEDYIGAEIDVCYQEFIYDLCKACREQLAKLVKDFCSYGERRTDEAL